MYVRLAISAALMVLFMQSLLIAATLDSNDAPPDTLLLMMNELEDMILERLASLDVELVINPINYELTDYEAVLVAGDLWGSEMIDEMRTYVQAGGAIILTGGAPFFIAGSTDLSSMADIIGASRYGNTWQEHIILSSDSPFCLPYYSNDTLCFMDDCSGGHADIRFPADSLINKVYWENGSLFSYGYYPYEGKFAFVAHYHHCEELEELFRATVLWALGSTMRGDADGSGTVNVSDAVYLVQYIFASGADPQPYYGSGDFDCDGVVNISDAVAIIAYVFASGEEPCDGC